MCQRICDLNNRNIINRKADTLAQALRTSHYLFHKTTDELRTEQRVSTSQQTLAKYDELTVEDTQADTTARTENNANAKQDYASQKVLTPSQGKVQDNRKPQDTKCSGTQSQATNK